MTGVTIVTVLLPSLPGLVGPYLPDIFEVFFRLAAFHVKKPRKYKWMGESERFLSAIK